MSVTTGKFILGTAQLGMNYGVANSLGKPSPSESHEILTVAYQQGIRTLDTADGYGNAIDIIAEYHRAHERFDIITKFHGISDTDALRNHLYDVLKNLKTDKFYCVMFHRFDDFRNYPQHVQLLGQLKAEGRIAKIGVSIYSNEEFEAALAMNTIDVIQFPFNILDNFRRRGRLMAIGRERQKEMHVRSVFLHGLLLLSANKIPDYLNELKPYIGQAQSIADRLGVGLRSAALQYAYCNPYVDKVIFGAESRDQILSNIKSASEPIDCADLKEFDSINVLPRHLLNPSNWNK
jgi:aryl-alcohol dehydrogenase-like predicted oxidoreductase